MIDFQPQYVPIQYGYSPLYFAIEAAQMDCLSLLLTRGADVNKRDKVIYCNSNFCCCLYNQLFIYFAVVGKYCVTHCCEGPED